MYKILEVITSIDPNTSEWPVVFKLKFHDGSAEPENFRLSYEEAMEIGLRLLAISLPNINRDTFKDYLSEEIK